MRPATRHFQLAIRFAGTHRDQGATTIEFALSALILVSFMFGVMLMCLGLYSYHFTSEAARQAARYAMVRGSQCPTNGNSNGTQTNCPLATSAALQTYLRSQSFPGIVSSNLTVATTWSANGTTWTSSPGTNNAPGDLVKVVVSYQFPVAIPLVTPTTLTMSSTSQMVIAD